MNRSIYMIGHLTYATLIWIEYRIHWIIATWAKHFSPRRINQCHRLLVADVLGAIVHPFDATTNLIFSEYTFLSLLAKKKVQMLAKLRRCINISDSSNMGIFNKKIDCCKSIMTLYWHIKNYVKLVKTSNQVVQQPLTLSRLNTPKCRFVLIAMSEKPHINPISSMYICQEMLWYKNRKQEREI